MDWRMSCIYDVWGFLIIVLWLVGLSCWRGERFIVGLLWWRFVARLGLVNRLRRSICRCRRCIRGFVGLRWVVSWFCRGWGIICCLCWCRGVISWFNWSLRGI